MMKNVFYDKQNDIRRYFPVSTFGYFAGGQLEVTINRFRYYPENLDENAVSVSWLIIKNFIF